MANPKKGSNHFSAKFIVWTISVVAVIVFGFIFFFPHQNPIVTSPKENSGNTNQPYIGKSLTKIDYTNQPYIGKSSAPVSIIEFGDYKCPYCKMFNEKVIPMIQQQLDSGEAKFYFMNYSFIHTDSVRAAKFAESVYAVLGNQTFWKFHDLLYSKQPEDSNFEKTDVYSEQYLTDTLKQIASDTEVNKVVQYFEANKADAAWQKDMDLVNQLNVNGTPTIFVNGELVKTMDDLKNMVNKAAQEK
ncbi:thioredoxin domain-containing protein [Neobacillus novalis]|uniref:Thioredoxin domain-containing protein n=1 Tax=Neobacillus novalis TaxID=220687 RepID=A0AA95MQ51_9BACI|nr:thioredoxin domain-containing protein [Neobacillus novalis]WHY86018.1 thioredoxin domain-containing protein [Neobacillus novalis]